MSNLPIPEAAQIATFLDPGYPSTDEIDALYDPVYGFMSSANIRQRCQGRRRTR